MGTLSIESIGQRLILHIIEDGADCDLSVFPTREMVFEKPDGTEVTKPGLILTPPGTDGRLYCELEEGLLTAGRWVVRAVLTIDATHKFKTAKVSFVPGI